MRLPVLAILSPLLLLGACHRHHGRGPLGAGQIKPSLYQTRGEIPVGVSGVADALATDLNGDGRVDLVVSTVSGQLTVLLGQGSGAFAAGQTLTVPGLPIKLKAADVDRDNDQDVAVLRAAADRVSILLNDGAGNLTQSAELATLPFPDEIVLGDCTGDGRVDLSVACLQLSDVIVYSGNGDGSFQPGANVVLPPSSEPSALAIGEVTGDGLPDLLVGEKQRGELLIFPARAGGGHAPVQINKVGSFPLSIAVSDLNRDGRGDIVVSNYASQSVSVLLAQNVGYQVGTLSVSGGPGNVLVRDVTGDGLTDITVAVFERSCVSIFPGLPDGSVGPEVEMSASGLPFRPLAGDIDGDGRDDLLVTAGGLDRISVYRAAGGRVNGAVNYETGIASPEFVAAADLDGDGKAEMAVTGSGDDRVSILSMRPDTVLGGQTAVPVLVVDIGRPCYTVVKGDYNGDGRMDLAVATDIGVKILANTSRPGAIALVQVPPGPDQVVVGGIGPFEVATADLNGDGSPDLVVTDVFAQRVTVLRSAGRGFSYDAVGVQVPLSGTPVGLALGDFTGDRIPDVAVTRNASAVVTVLRNDGTGRLAQHADVPVGGGPTYLRAADFNRDGRLDLITSNAATNDVTVLFSRGGGFVPVKLASGTVPTALLAQDLNGDGTADIMVASLVGADFRVLHGNGGGAFPVQSTFPGTYKATSADAADVDGDGLLDLLLASVETSRLSVIRGLAPATL